jgi:hypothetical protein
MTPENTKVAIFMSYPAANHLATVCGGCHEVETIYISPASIMRIMSTAKFNVILGDEPSEERKAAADFTWANRNAIPGDVVHDGLPELPREWLRQLHDDLRAFGSAS